MSDLYLVAFIRLLFKLPTNEIVTNIPHVVDRKTAVECGSPLSL